MFHICISDQKMDDTLAAKCPFVLTEVLWSTGEWGVGQHQIQHKTQHIIFIISR